MANEFVETGNKEYDKSVRDLFFSLKNKTTDMRELLLYKLFGLSQFTLNEVITSLNSLGFELPPFHPYTHKSKKSMFPTKFFLRTKKDTIICFFYFK